MQYLRRWPHVSGAFFPQGLKPSVFSIAFGTTDEFGGYLSATAVLTENKTIRHKDRIYVDGDIYTNTIESAFSLLKHDVIDP
jgi:hypothetical protein